jgi:hypothetical protein
MSHARSIGGIGATAWTQKASRNCAERVQNSQPIECGASAGFPSGRCPDYRSSRDRFETALHYKHATYPTSRRTDRNKGILTEDYGRVEPLNIGAL